MDRLGYYVEGRFFHNKVAQAIAYAEHCVRTFGRNVKVYHVDHEKKGRIIKNIKPQDLGPLPDKTDIVDPSCEEAA